MYSRLLQISLQISGVSGVVLPEALEPKVFDEMTNSGNKSQIFSVLQEQKNIWLLFPEFTILPSYRSSRRGDRIFF
jgi:hypothetical protein